MLYIRFFHEFKKKHYGTSFLFLICIGSSLLVLFIVFTILLGDYALAFIIVSFIYIGYLIYTVVLNNDIGFSLFITLLVLFLLLLFIPIQFGGLKGQKVMFNEYDNNICFLYTYYGNYDGLYEFKSNDDILLIPIEKGYILYNYKVKKLNLHFYFYLFRNNTDRI